MSHQSSLEVKSRKEFWANDTEDVCVLEKAVEAWWPWSHVPADYNSFPRGGEGCSFSQRRTL